MPASASIDPVGAVAVHGACGIFGTLGVGLFATGDFGLPGPTGADTSAVVTGLFYGGGGEQLLAQVKGSAFCTAVALGAGLALMFAVKATGTLRVSEEGELEGIDIHEHGAPAYHPEFAYMGAGTSPGGGFSMAAKAADEKMSAVPAGER